MQMFFTLNIIFHNLNLMLLNWHGFLKQEVWGIYYDDDKLIKKVRKFSYQSFQ